MKKLLFILLALALVGPADAQKKLYGKNNRAEAVAIGVKVGGNLSQFYYSPSYGYGFNELNFDILTNRLNPLFGINVEIPLLKGVVYVSPEVLFNVLGDSRLFELDTWRFQAKVNYLEARVPVAIAIPVSDGFKPYVFAAPSVSMRLPSFGPFNSEFKKYDISKSVNSVAVDTSNMTRMDFGIVLGVGFRFKFNFPGFSMLMKLEGGYYNGKWDTFENITYSEQVPSVGPAEFNINYSRQNRGIEAALTIAIPLDFHSRADCFYWSEVEKKKDKNRGAFGF